MRTAGKRRYQRPKSMRPRCPVCRRLLIQRRRLVFYSGIMADRATAEWHWVCDRHGVVRRKTTEPSPTRLEDYGAL